MGALARKKVAQKYSWGNVVDNYLDLWDDLAGLPVNQEEEARLRGAVHPANPHYMDIFGAYYSSRMAEACRSGRTVRWSRAGEAVYRGRDKLVIYQLIEDNIQEDSVRRMLFAARKPVPLEKLADSVFNGAGRFSDRDFLLLWALKHDLLEFV
jgi:hypothetical protein